MALKTLLSTAALRFGKFVSDNITSLCCCWALSKPPRFTSDRKYLCRSPEITPFQWKEYWHFHNYYSSSFSLSTESFLHTTTAQGPGSYPNNPILPVWNSKQQLAPLSLFIFILSSTRVKVPYLPHVLIDIHIFSQVLSGPHACLMDD